MIGYASRYVHKIKEDKRGVYPCLHYSLPHIEHFHLQEILSQSLFSQMEIEITGQPKTAIQIPCCLCGTQIIPNNANQCGSCLAQQFDLKVRVCKHSRKVCTCSGVIESVPVPLPVPVLLLSRKQNASVCNPPLRRTERFIRVAGCKTGAIKKFRNAQQHSFPIRLQLLLWRYS